VNGVALDGGLPGQVRRTWDANGTATATRYVYDEWGRVLKVVRPGDSLSVPSVSYAYYDAPTMPATFTEPLLVETTYADQSAARQFYDGLGRLVQTQQARADIEGQAQQRDVLVSQGYGFGTTVYIGEIYEYFAPKRRHW
jgi:YD repeat-containing protein